MLSSTNVKLDNLQSQPYTLRQNYEDSTNLDGCQTRYDRTRTGLILL